MCLAFQRRARCIKQVHDYRPSAETKMMCAVFVLVFSGLAQLVMPGPPKTCVNGFNHKPSPSPESEALEACGAWQTLSCCTANLAWKINRYMDLRLSNFSCRHLSQECLDYMEVYT